MKKYLNMALCEGRHEMPQATDGNIFGNAISDVTKTMRLEKDAWMKLWDVCQHRGWLVSTESEEEDMGGYRIDNGIHLNLYVTGLTVALIAALNVCRREGITVTLWHYDRDTDTYFAQEVKY